MCSTDPDGPAWNRTSADHEPFDKILTALRINGFGVLGLRTQNPPPFGSWGFDSPSRHHAYYLRDII